MSYGVGARDFDWQVSTDIGTKRNECKCNERITKPVEPLSKSHNCQRSVKEASQYQNHKNATWGLLDTRIQQLPKLKRAIRTVHRSTNAVLVYNQASAAPLQMPRCKQRDAADQNGHPRQRPAQAV